MQLSELKQLPPSERKTVLLGLENYDLDVITSELVDDTFGYSWILGKRAVLGSSGRHWQPSVDLNQAYELVESNSMSVNREIVEGKSRRLSLFRHREGKAAKFMDSLYESEAKVHARAVTVLAVLGMLEEEA